MKSRKTELVDRVMALYYWLSSGVGSRTSSFSDQSGAKRYGGSPRLYDFLADVGIALGNVPPTQRKAVEEYWIETEIYWFCIARSIETGQKIKESRDQKVLIDAWEDIRGHWESMKKIAARRQRNAKDKVMYRRGLDSLGDEFVKRGMMWVLSDGGIRMMTEAPEAPNACDLINLLGPAIDKPRKDVLQ